MTRLEDARFAIPSSLKATLKKDKEAIVANIAYVLMGRHYVKAGYRGKGLYKISDVWYVQFYPEQSEFKLVHYFEDSPHNPRCMHVLSSWLQLQFGYTVVD